MTRKLKSSARKSRRNPKLFVVGFIVILAVAIGAVFVFAQSNLKGENNGNTQPRSSNNTNVRATVAMAKSFPNTATSGFFINVEDNCNQSAQVDKTYTVFGYVTEGMEVVDAISKVAADADE